MNGVFADRKEAGHRLAQKLSKQIDTNLPTIVLGLPRGGVVVADAIAQDFHLPLDVCLVKKLGIPNYPETAMGALVLEDDDQELIVIDSDIVCYNQISSEQLQAIAVKVKQELNYRQNYYRPFRPSLEIKNHVVIVVDDGLATGLTMEAAIKALAQKHPQKIIVAIPVGTKEAIQKIRTLVDEVVCLSVPKAFRAVGCWYQNFAQVSDEEVSNLLSKGSRVKNA